MLLEEKYVWIVAKYMYVYLEDKSLFLACNQDFLRCV